MFSSVQVDWIQCTVWTSKLGLEEVTRCSTLVQVDWMNKYNKMKNADIFWDLNIEEDWLKDFIMTRKLLYLCHVKCHSGLE